MRRKRVDANQKDIVNSLRMIPGISVSHTHTVGSGFPDVVVGYRGINYLVEIKTDERCKLTPDEATWHRKWNGSVMIATNAADIFKMIEGDQKK